MRYGIRNYKVLFVQFCCWENPHFSHSVLYELLWQISFAYTNELRYLYVSSGIFTLAQVFVR